MILTDEPHKWVRFFSFSIYIQQFFCFFWCTFLLWTTRFLLPINEENRSFYSKVAIWWCKVDENFIHCVSSVNCKSIKRNHLNFLFPNFISKIEFLLEKLQYSFVSFQYVGFSFISARHKKTKLIWNLIVFCSAI